VRAHGDEIVGVDLMRFDGLASQVQRHELHETGRRAFDPGVLGVDRPALGIE
jgi:hypothetical protein